MTGPSETDKNREERFKILYKADLYSSKAAGQPFFHKASRVGGILYIAFAVVFAVQMGIAVYDTLSDDRFESIGDSVVLNYIGSNPGDNTALAMDSPVLSFDVGVELTFFHVNVSSLRKITINDINKYGQGQSLTSSTETVPKTLSATLNNQIRLGTSPQVFYSNGDRESMTTLFEVMNRDIVSKFDSLDDYLTYRDQFSPSTFYPHTLVVASRFSPQKFQDVAPETCRLTALPVSVYESLLKSTDRFSDRPRLSEITDFGSSTYDVMDIIQGTNTKEFHVERTTGTTVDWEFFAMYTDSPFDFITTAMCDGVPVDALRTADKMIELDAINATATTIEVSDEICASLRVYSADQKILIHSDWGTESAAITSVTGTDTSCVVTVTRDSDIALNHALTAETADPYDYPTSPPSDWTCDSSMYNDGSTCDCGCGAFDPDCTGAVAGPQSSRCSDKSSTDTYECNLAGSCVVPTTPQMEISIPCNDAAHVGASRVRGLVHFDDILSNGTCGYDQIFGFHPQVLYEDNSLGQSVPNYLCCSRPTGYLLGSDNVDATLDAENKVTFKIHSPKEEASFPVYTTSEATTAHKNLNIIWNPDNSARTFNSELVSVADDDVYENVQHITVKKASGASSRRAFVGQVVSSTNIYKSMVTIISERNDLTFPLEGPYEVRVSSSNLASSQIITINSAQPPIDYEGDQQLQLLHATIEGSLSLGLSGYTDTPLNSASTSVDIRYIITAQAVFQDTEYLFVVEPDSSLGIFAPFWFKGVLTVPDAWTGDPAEYADGSEYCHCGRGAPDPNCFAPTYEESPFTIIRCYESDGITYTEHSINDGTMFCELPSVGDEAVTCTTTAIDTSRAIPLKLKFNIPEGESVPDSVDTSSNIPVQSCWNTTLESYVALELYRPFTPDPHTIDEISETNPMIPSSTTPTTPNELFDQCTRFKPAPSSVSLETAAFVIPTYDELNPSLAPLTNVSNDYTYPLYNVTVRDGFHPYAVDGEQIEYYAEGVEPPDSDDGSLDPTRVRSFNFSIPYTHRFDGETTTITRQSAKGVFAEIVFDFSYGLHDVEIDNNFISTSSSSEEVCAIIDGDSDTGSTEQRQNYGALWMKGRRQSPELGLVPAPPPQLVLSPSISVNAELTEEVISLFGLPNDWEKTAKARSEFYKTCQDGIKAVAWSGVANGDSSLSIEPGYKYKLTGTISHVPTYLTNSLDVTSFESLTVVLENQDFTKSSLPLQQSSQAIVEFELWAGLDNQKHVKQAFTLTDLIAKLGSSLAVLRLGGSILVFARRWLPWLPTELISYEETRNYLAMKGKIIPAEVDTSTVETTENPMQRMHEMRSHV